MTALTPMQTFQENLKAKLRDDIASMLPDEAIQELVSRVINEEFFTGKKIRAPGVEHWREQYITGPSAFQEMVIKAAEPLIKEAVAKVLADNAPMIASQIDQMVKDGLVRLTVSSIDRQMSEAMRCMGEQVHMSLTNAIQNLR